jgi:hypothetical protein
MSLVAAGEMRAFGAGVAGASGALEIWPAQRGGALDDAAGDAGDGGVQVHGVSLPVQAA